MLRVETYSQGVLTDSKLFQHALRLNDLIAFRQKYNVTGTDRAQRFSLFRCVQDLNLGRSCTDDRDRIYGFLGIADDDLMEPDYTLSTGEVFRQYASRCLLSQSLSILHESGLGPDEFASPSYLPCIFPRTTQSRSLESALPLFKAGSQYHVWVSMTSSRSILIRGTIIDSIGRHGRWTSHKGTTMFDLIDPPNHDPSAILVAELDVIHGFTRLIKTGWNRDVESGRERPVASKHPEGAAFLRTISLAHLDTTNNERFFSEESLLHIRRSLVNRAVFFTSHGHIGLGDRYLQDGDKVVIFDGGKTPFVLREKPTSNGRLQWALVGDCYLEGWMDGSYAGHDVLNMDDQETNGQELTDEQELPVELGHGPQSIPHPKLQRGYQAKLWGPRQRSKSRQTGLCSLLSARRSHCYKPLVPARGYPSCRKFICL